MYLGAFGGVFVALGLLRHRISSSSLFVLSSLPPIPSSAPKVGIQQENDAGMGWGALGGFWGAVQGHLGGSGGL